MLGFVLIGLDKYSNVTAQKNSRKALPKKIQERELLLRLKQKEKSLRLCKTKFGSHIFYFIKYISYFMGREVFVRESDKKQKIFFYSSWPAAALREKRTEVLLRQP